MDKTNAYVNGLVIKRFIRKKVKKMKKERQNKVSSLVLLLLFISIFGSIQLISLSEVNNLKRGILENEIVDNSDDFSGDLKNSMIESAMTEVVSTESTAGSSNPSITVDGAGNVHVVWMDSTDYDNSGTDTDIFYKRWDVYSSM